MSPLGPPHCSTVERLDELQVRSTPPGMRIRLRAFPELALAVDGFLK